ncbi:histone H3.3 isoform X1 [Diachasma alloeum]|uniref:histone H3.3 isoform X1 n=1 Tax=Diachasma alloeum TaxID=454923 RepID=UPI0007383E41|nr:histone H3.3 isoform X1 [Diachasma alloeum]
MVRRKAEARKSGTKSKSPNKGKSKTKTLVNRKRKVKPGVRALQEIRQLRRSTKLLIPKLPFSRLVREIIRDLFPRKNIDRMQATALEALQEATETYLVQFFEDSILLAFHCKRVTLMQRDMVLMRRLRGRDDVINR